MTQSQAINEVIIAAQAEGNSVSEVSTGWTKVKEVAHMVKPASQTLITRFAGHGNLSYWTNDPTPHNRASQGLTDEETLVSIEFPI